MLVIYNCWASGLWEQHNNADARVGLNGKFIVVVNRYRSLPTKCKHHIPRSMYYVIVARIAEMHFEIYCGSSFSIIATRATVWLLFPRSVYPRLMKYTRATIPTRDLLHHQVVQNYFNNSFGVVCSAGEWKFYSYYGCSLMKISAH